MNYDKLFFSNKKADIDDYSDSITRESASKAIRAYVKENVSTQPILESIRVFDELHRDAYGNSLFTAESALMIAESGEENIRKLAESFAVMESTGLKGDNYMKEHFINTFTKSMLSIKHTSPFSIYESAMTGRNSSGGQYAALEAFSAANLHLNNEIGTGGAITLLGMMSKTDIMETMTLNTESDPNYEMQFDIETILNPNTQEWVPRVQAIRNGDLSDVFDPIELRPAPGPDNAFVLDPKTLTGTVPDSVKAKTGWLKFGGYGGNLITGSGYKMNAESMNDDIHIEDLLYISGYELVTSGHTEKEVDDNGNEITWVEVDTTKPIYKSANVFLPVKDTQGNVANRIFSGRKDFITMITKEVTVGEGESATKKTVARQAEVTELIVGKIHMDKGSFAITAGNTGYKITGVFDDAHNEIYSSLPTCLVGVRIFATIFDATNQRGSVQTDTDVLTHKLRTRYNRIAAITITPYLLDQFKSRNVGNDHASYTGFVVNKVASLYSETRMLSAEKFLRSTSDKDPSSFTTTPKYNSFSKVIKHDVANIGVVNGADVFETARQVLRRKINKVIGEAYTWLNIPNDERGELITKGHWVFYTNQNTADAMLSMTTTNTVINSTGTQVENNKYGYIITNQASWTDELDRNVRIIANPEPRNVNKYAIGTLWSAHPKFPGLVYKPVVNRALTGIDPKFSTNPALLFFTRDGFHHLRKTFIKVSVANNSIEEYETILLNSQRRFHYNAGNAPSAFVPQNANIYGNEPTAAQIDGFDSFVKEHQVPVNSTKIENDYLNGEFHNAVTNA